MSPRCQAMMKHYLRSSKEESIFAHRETLTEDEAMVIYKDLKQRMREDQSLTREEIHELCNKIQAEVYKLYTPKS